jgi:methionine-rich copper-binding protein CopC
LFSPLALVLAASVVSAGFASHSNVVSTNPKAGATLTSVPKQMVFKFSDGIIDRGTTFTFTDRTKMYYPPLKFRSMNTTVRVSLPKRPAPGPITVYYRVLSADGHPVQGKVEMTYAPPGASAS